MKKSFLTIIALPLLLLSCSPGNSNVWHGMVNDVHDGDTFTINNKKIRLFGVDTPELNDQYHNFEQTSNIDYIYGMQATRFARKRILKHNVTVIEQTSDAYGRHVAKINYGYDLGLSLVKNGLGRVAYISVVKNNPFYTKDAEYYKLLLEAQYYAYQHNNGIWAHKDLFKIIFPKA